MGAVAGRNGDTDTPAPGKSPSCRLCGTSLCSDLLLQHEPRLQAALNAPAP